MSRKPVKNSSNIVSGSYADGTATVQFKSGAIYTSKDVSEKEWEKFAATFDDEKTSTGSHYAKNLRNKSWKKLGEK